jgi:hypothetical protein
VQQVEGEQMEQVEATEADKEVAIRMIVLESVLENINKPGTGSYASAFLRIAELLGIKSGRCNKEVDKEVAIRMIVLENINKPGSYASAFLRIAELH